MASKFDNKSLQYPISQSVFIVPTFLLNDCSFSFGFLDAFLSVIASLMTYALLSEIIHDSTSFLIDPFFQCILSAFSHVLIFLPILLINMKD